MNACTSKIPQVSFENLYETDNDSVFVFVVVFITLPVSSSISSKVTLHSVHSSDAHFIVSAEVLVQLSVSKPVKVLQLKKFQVK